MKTKSYLHIVITIILFFLFSSAIWGIDRADEYRARLKKMQEQKLERREAIRMERRRRNIDPNATNEAKFKKNKIARLEHKIRKLETSIKDVESRLDLVEKIILEEDIGSFVDVDVNIPQESNSVP